MCIWYAEFVLYIVCGMYVIYELCVVGVLVMVCVMVCMSCWGCEYGAWIVFVCVSGVCIYCACIVWCV